MAESIEKPEETEIKIPVFSVVKKGIIVKNIILNIPPPEPRSSIGPGEESDVSNGEDDPILIGRHPDCHIVLDHPSISRFHLEVRAIPRLQQLSLVDRSSVHGTWVSGNKIQPKVPVNLIEGDTVRLGASTRVYRLHWVPVSNAVKMEIPLAVLHEEDEETLQEGNSGQLIPNQYEVWVSEIPSAPPLPEFMNLSSTDEPFSFPSERETQSPELGKQCSMFCSFVPMLESAGFSLPMEGDNRTPVSISANEVPSERENRSPLRSEKRATLSSSLLSRRSKSISSLRIHKGKNEENIGTHLEEGRREETLCRVLFDNIDEKKEETFDSDKENVTPGVPRSRKSKKSSHIKLQSSSLKSSTVLNVVGGDEIHSEKEYFTPEFPRDLKPDSPIPGNCVKSEGEETFAPLESLVELQRSFSKVITCFNEEDVLRSGKENRRPEVTRDPKPKKSVFQNRVKTDKENSTAELPRDLKPDTPIPGYRVKDEGEETFRLVKLRKSFSNVITDLNGEEDELQSGKENRTPEVALDPKPKKSIFQDCVKIDSREKYTFPSDKENLTPKVSGNPKSKKPLSKSHDRIEREMMRKREERVPFRSLLENSPSRISNFVDHTCNSSANHPDSSSSQSTNQLLNKAGEEKKKWNIVVDASCFLDEESRKSLQLLEGLKGTHLIIPRIVIRELDCLKRRESLFRKATKASSMLQWIEMCMVRASWWIHVQSSSEMMPVAPTPPVSPRSNNESNEFGAGASNSMVFSTCGSLMEIVSPTAEDHILGCALLFKKFKNDGKFILLTNSVTMKIKAMAEGLLCETPNEFRQSLVNPYSKRFLWVDSSPRGSTWSCSDEAVLTENYYHQCPAVRKTAKAAEGAKGLKLILLHNSHYGKTNSVK